MQWALRATAQKAKMPLKRSTCVVTVPIVPAPARSLRFGPQHPHSRAPHGAGGWHAGCLDHVQVCRAGASPCHCLMKALQGGFSLLFTPGNMLYLYEGPHGKASGAAHLGSLFWDPGKLQGLNRDIEITNNFYLKIVFARGTAQRS